MVVLWPSELPGAVRRVPQEYATIQAAFDVVADDDTVFVELGTYAEELQAPPRRFWLVGEVVVDTGDFARPVIDPSSLDSARWRKCITIPDGCQLTIERMRFVNGAAMYPRTGWNSGGIFVHSDLPTTFRQCTFDSVYRSIVDAIDTLPPPPLPVQYTIEDCHFINAPRIQVRASNSASMVIRRSYFEGLKTASGLVVGGDSSLLEDCMFTGDSIAGALNLHGTNLVVRNCVFGPIDTCRSQVLFVHDAAGVVIHGNLFHDIRCISASQFSDFGTGSETAICVRDNCYMDIRASFSGLGFARVSPDPISVLAKIDSNWFLNIIQDSSWATGKTLNFGHYSLVRGNRFFDLFPRSVACVSSDRPANSPPSEFRYNQFEAGDYAIYSPYQSTDAVWNYWGDPSGPYNATYNPDGLGARVDDNVLFDPWSPDTNFLSVPGIGKPLPEEFVFDAYPNPFNSTVHLRLIPNDIQIVKVELFDLLGRSVNEIWRGPIAYQKDIEFDGSQLASGVYFARVTNTIFNRPLATKKLVLLK